MSRGDSDSNASEVPAEALVQFIARVLVGLLMWWLEGRAA
jgi:hypothetical protein